MRPNIGVLLLGLFLGWSGLVRWVERGAWATLLLIALVKPWHWDLPTHFDLNWAHVVIALLGLLIGTGIGVSANEQHHKSISET